MADICNEVDGGRDLNNCTTIGGYRALYLINKDSAISFPVSANTSVISAISGLTTGEVFKYELLNDGNTFTSEMTSDDNAGTLFWTQTAVMNLNKLDPEMTYQLKALTAARLWAVVENNMGEFFLLGRTRLVKGSAATAQTGGALGDQNGYIVTLTGAEPEAFYHLSQTAITTLLNNTADND